MKKPRRGTVSEELNITSMMDMFTIILVFLLKSYSTEDISVAASAEMQLPLSTSAVKPKLAVNVVVSKVGVIVDGVPLMALTKKADETGREWIAVPDEEKKGQMITRLYDRLLEKAEQAKRIAEATASEEHAFKGEILMQCDKELPFSVIREVMYTAGQAQFSNFRFVVYSTTS
jgi:biopolymer transport protein ExbD